ncbi:MAG TPA: hypothetical protein VJL61_12255 [Rhodanobacteraceae bacterium]|nr:hypothetical protein [Rhodanobacteraceae bacterium]
MRLKSLKLVFDLASDGEGAVELPIDECTIDAWERQFQRISRSIDPASDIERLREGAGAKLRECLDWDLQPPSERQLKFADAIARELNLTLSAEVIRYKGAMSGFLDQYGGEFKRGCAQRFSSDPK